MMQALGWMVAVVCALGWAWTWCALRDACWWTEHYYREARQLLRIIRDRSWEEA